MKKTPIFCMSILTIIFLFITAFESYADNKSLCKEWCDQHKEICDKCSDKSGCGIGYKAIVTFKHSPYDYWYACAGSERNKEACEAWCNAHKPQCAKCDEHVGCGIGYKKIMSFTGKGKNWHACEKR